MFPIAQEDIEKLFDGRNHCPDSVVDKNVSILLFSKKFALGP